jgi:hypothetical protein
MSQVKIMQVQLWTLQHFVVEHIHCSFFEAYKKKIKCMIFVVDAP